MEDPGDLRLTVEGGVLYPVCTMPVEEYLLGVVPYEMSEYFPVEALKAQAVCARTYALNKLGANADYDLVDTTNDQVFKGVNYAYVNAIRAVRETAGVVGTYKGKLAICYYSASNGGQTELVQNVWSGRGDWDYYKVVDDPYDVENPESVVRRARIAKNGEVREGFKAILFSYVLPEMLRQGYIASAENFRIDNISAMSLGKPAHAEPSRAWTELTLTFNEDGTFSSTFGQKTATGTFTFNAETNQLALKYDSSLLALGAINAYAYINGANLQLLFPMDKLLTLLTSLGSASSQLSTITTMLKSYDSVKIGFEFSK